MGRAGYLDVADIRTCPSCGHDYLRAIDCDGFVIPLEPWSAPGEDVADGWYLRRYASTAQWSVHIARFAEPGVFAFYNHRCEQRHREGTSVTTPDPFGTANAPGASGPPMKELAGKLLLVDVTTIERGINIPGAEPADAVKCHLVDLTTGDAHANAALWGKVIVNQFAPGTKYVGRIVQGQASGSNNPPWTWVDGDENDKAVAIRYITYAAGQSVSAQAAPAAPVAAPVTPPPAAPVAAPQAPPWA